MLKMSAFMLVALLPVTAQGGDRAQPIPNQTTVTVEVALDCIVKDDLTLKDCTITNSRDVLENDALEALHAIEAKSTPVTNGKPGDKIHIRMKLAR